jgi:hypothetical protein
MVLKSHERLILQGFDETKNRPWKDISDLFKVCYYGFIKFLEDKTVYLLEDNMLCPKT